MTQPDTRETVTRLSASLAAVLGDIRRLNEVLPALLAEKDKRGEIFNDDWMRAFSNAVIGYRMRVVSGEGVRADFERVNSYLKVIDIHLNRDLSAAVTELGEQVRRNEDGGTNATVVDTGKLKLIIDAVTRTVKGL